MRKASGHEEKALPHRETTRTAKVRDERINLVQKEERRPECSFERRTSRSPARTRNAPQTVLSGPPDGRQPVAAQGAVEPGSGTSEEDEAAAKQSPQTFLDSLSAVPELLKGESEREEPYF